MRQGRKLGLEREAGKTEQSEVSLEGIARGRREGYGGA